MRTVKLFTLMLVLCLLGLYCNKNREIGKTVKIGNQVWMAENLNVDHYRNGDPIPQVDVSDWDDLTTGAWCYYNNDPTLGEKFGKLYNWYAVNDPRGLGPKGWHVPTHNDRKELEMYLGMSQSDADIRQGWRGTDEGGKLKAPSGWDSTEEGINGTNETGFSALPGGYFVDEHGGFMNIYEYAGFWSSTLSRSGQTAITRHLIDADSEIASNFEYKINGFSVRLIRD